MNKTTVLFFIFLFSTGFIFCQQEKKKEKKVSVAFFDGTVPTKNAIVMPNLGRGLIYSYKKTAFQVPFTTILKLSQ